VQDYIQSFLPLFVAINVLGILPMYLGLTEQLSAAGRRRLTFQAVGTAFILAVLVLFAGQLIFKLLGITVNDLRVGGGLILLVLSISNLIFDDYRRRDPKRNAEPGSTVGVVPLGIPLIMGPAAITAVLVAQQGYGYLPTLVALVANMALPRSRLRPFPGAHHRPLGQPRRGQGGEPFLSRHLGRHDPGRDRGDGQGATLRAY